MTRSRIIGLMERKLTADLAADRVQLAGLVRQSAEALRMAERLEGMLNDRRVKPGQEALAATFRLGRRLTSEIAAEGARQADRAAELKAEAAARRAVLTQKDRKRERLAEARRAATEDEASAREARIAASLPPGAGRRSGTGLA